MFHRTIILPMIAGFLTGQLAAVPHIHASEHSGHAKPHVHSDWFARLFKTDHHSHSHRGYSTSHRSHKHTHASGHHSHNEHEHPAAPNPVGNDHDSTCVHLPDLNVVSSTNTTIDQSAVAGSMAFIVEPANGLSGSALLSAIQSKAPPDGQLLGCARFLKLRTLRI